MATIQKKQNSPQKRDAFDDGVYGWDEFPAKDVGFLLADSIYGRLLEKSGIEQAKASGSYREAQLQSLRTDRDSGTAAQVF